MLIRLAPGLAQILSYVVLAQIGGCFIRKAAAQEKTFLFLEMISLPAIEFSKFQGLPALSIFFSRSSPGSIRPALLHRLVVSPALDLLCGHPPIQIPMETSLRLALKAAICGLTTPQLTTVTSYTLRAFSGISLIKPI